MVTTTLWHVEGEKDILETIGKVTIRWAALDVLLAQILTIACENSAIADDLIFGSNDAGKKRLEKFDRAIGGSRFREDERKKVLEITGRLASLLGTRNELVHSPLDVYFQIHPDNRIEKFIVRRTKGGKEIRFSMQSADAHLQHLMAALEALEDVRDLLEVRYGEGSEYPLEE